MPFIQLATIIQFRDAVERRIRATEEQIKTARQLDRDDIVQHLLSKQAAYHEILTTIDVGEWNE